LDDHNITYVREDFSTKKYFLDFLIEKNGKKIDLEIDGKQHKDRKDHDKERDEYLTDLGYIVYRID
jgi:very-short-patch-repair endonuclease